MNGFNFVFVSFFAFFFAFFFLKIFLTFYFYFILLYNTVLVLPYIDMNPKNMERFTNLRVILAQGPC